MTLKINYVVVLLRMLAASSLITYNFLSVSAEDFTGAIQEITNNSIADVEVSNITVPEMGNFFDSPISTADSTGQIFMNKMMLHSPTNPCIYYLAVPYEIPEEDIKVGVDPPTKMLYIEYSTKQNVDEGYHWKKNIIVQKVSELCDVNREVVESKEAAYAMKDGWLMAFFPYKGQFESTSMKFEYRSIVTSEGMNINGKFNYQLPVSSNYIQLSKVPWRDEE